jgi:hypothetical protein
VQATFLQMLKTYCTMSGHYRLAFEALDAANLERLRQIISNEQARWPGA